MAEEISLEKGKNEDTCAYTTHVKRALNNTLCTAHNRNGELRYVTAAA